MWQAEGLVALPVAVQLRHSQRGAAVYDARDLATQSARFARLPGPWRALLQRRERDWARSMDDVVTVSTPYAEVLARDWERQPRIIWNGPSDYQPADPPRRLWHERLGLADGDTRGALPGPGAGRAGHRDSCARPSAWCPARSSWWLATAPTTSGSRLTAATLAHAGRIHFTGPVAPADILDCIAAADISAMPVEGDTLNHQLNTPTKLFDAMGAGVPVVASDLPGMAPIVRDTGCGELCDPADPADIARAIRTIVEAPPERRAAYRAACLTAAREVYAWERQAPVLLDMYRSLRVSP